MHFCIISVFHQQLSCFQSNGRDIFTLCRHVSLFYFHISFVILNGNREGSGGRACGAVLIFALASKGYNSVIKGAACQDKMELRRVLFILCISHYKSVLFCEILTIDGDINVFPIQFARTHGSCILRNAVVRIFWCYFLGKGADWNQHKHHRSRSQCRKPLFLSQNKKPPSFFSKEIQSPV